MVQAKLSQESSGFSYCPESPPVCQKRELRPLKEQSASVKDTGGLSLEDNIMLRKYKFDGGKWGYKDYKTIQKYKKDYCEICKQDKSLLHIHHKDSDTRNSNKDNLMTVCPKCHSKLHPKPHTIIRKSKYIEEYGKMLHELSDEFKLPKFVIRYRIKHNLPLTPKTSKYLRRYGKSRKELIKGLIPVEPISLTLRR